MHFSTAKSYLLAISKVTAPGSLGCVTFNIGASLPRAQLTVYFNSKTVLMHKVVSSSDQIFSQLNLFINTAAGRAHKIKLVLE